MEQGYTRSCTLHPRTWQCFTEGCKHHPPPQGWNPGMQRSRSKLFYLVFNTQFWPLRMVLSMSNPRQSREELQVLSTSGTEPLCWTYPMPEARLGGGWWIKCLPRGQHSKSVAEGDSWPYILLFFHSARSTQQLEGDRSCRMSPCSVILFAQLWSAPDQHCVCASPLKQGCCRSPALQE